MADRIAHKHIVEHLLDDREVACVPDEVGAEFSLTGSPERHVVTQDLALHPVGADDGVQGLVRLPPVRVIQLDVIGLRAANDSFLLGNGEIRPRSKVVQVLLHDDIASPGEVRIVVTEDGGAVEGVASWILRAVDEAQEVTVVEIAEPLHLIDDRDGIAERDEEQAFQLKAEVAALGADMKEGSPDVATAVCLAPCIAAKLCSWAGRFFWPSRSQASLPIPTLQER